MAPTRPPSPRCARRARPDIELGTMVVRERHFCSRCRWLTKSSIPASRMIGPSAARSPCLVHRLAGLGHQVCSDYVRLLDAQLARYRIHVLTGSSRAPASSPEGRRYLLAAMAAAANFAWANRQADADGVCRATGNVLGLVAPPAPPSRCVRRRAQRREGGEAPRRARVSTARGRHEPSPRASTRSRPRTGRSASRSSSRARWARRASSLQASPPRCSARSGRRATALTPSLPHGRPRKRILTATSFAASSRRAAS